MYVLNILYIYIYIYIYIYTVVPSQYSEAVITTIVQFIFLLFVCGSVSELSFGGEFFGIFLVILLSMKSPVARGQH